MCVGVKFFVRLKEAVCYCVIIGSKMAINGGIFGTHGWGTLVRFDDTKNRALSL